MYQKQLWNWQKKHNGVESFIVEAPNTTMCLLEIITMELLRGN